MKRAPRPQAPAPLKAAASPWLLLALAVAGAAAYVNVLNAPFVFDDFATVIENPRLADGVIAAAVSTPPGTPVAGRPLAHLTLAINYAAGGLNPRGYHILNLALHVACGLILFGFLKLALQAMLADPPPLRRRVARDLAFACAALWIVHPLNSEVVDYVTQRTESLMALWYLLVLYAATRALHENSPRWRAIAIAACLAGAASKESIATAPLMVMLYDRVFAFTSLRDAWRARGRLYAGLMASWIVLAVMLLWNGQTTSAGFASAHVSTWPYLLNQTVMIGRYLQLALWPGPLVVYYGWPVQLTLAAVWPQALLVVVLLAGTGALLRSAPRYGFWAAWFFIALAPTSSVIPIATEVGAERRMYLPLVGVIVLAVMAAFTVLRRIRPETGAAPARPAASAAWGSAPLLAAAVLMLAVPLAARTVLRNREYRSALTLAETVLQRWPTPNAHQLVGLELARLGRHAEAIPHLREASRGYPPADYFLGLSLLKTGDIDGAVTSLDRFIAGEPASLAARGAHGLLADALAERGRFDRAVPHYQAYLEAHPNDAAAWNALGIALAQGSRTSEAVIAFSRAAALEPRSAEFKLNAATALAQQGRRQEAAAFAQQALQLDPANAAAAALLRALTPRDPQPR